MANAADVKKLRELTDAPMMACKKALDDANGDMEKAAALVRERTGAKMDARAADRTAGDGIVYAYLHKPNPELPPKQGVLLQLSCETDFVAKGEKFQSLAHDIALHIAAMKPSSISEDDIDAALVEKEREFAKKQALDEGKPEHLLERILEGRMKKFFSEQVLLNQPFVKDDSKTVGQLISEIQAQVGEKIEVAKFTRYAIG